MVSLTRYEQHYYVQVWGYLHYSAQYSVLSNRLNRPAGAGEDCRVESQRVAYRAPQGVRLFLKITSNCWTTIQRQPDTGNISIRIDISAIWNKNKVVTAISIGLWGTNGAFCVYCKLLLPCGTGYRALTLAVVTQVNISSRFP